MSEKLLFTFEFTATACQDRWPSVSIFDKEFEIKNHTFVDVEHVYESSGEKYFEIFYFNKKENDTLVHNGNIVEDQSLILQRCWIDNILCEPWMLTNGIYYPNYFTGFLSQFPDASKAIKSQLIWHFPGSFKFNLVTPFWQWYAYERRKYIKSANNDKDQERWEGYSGSFNDHKDLVKEIKELL